MVSMKLY